MEDFDSLPDDSQAASSAPQASPIAATAVPNTQDAVSTPSFDSLSDDSETYSTPTEKLKTLAEGAARGLGGPLATGLESALLHNEPQQLARQNENPITSTLGEVGSLVGGSMAGIGLGGALAKAGEIAGLGSEAVGLGKLGSGVVKGAIENLVYQGQSEVSKAILNDPGQSTDTAIADMGLAAVIGGGFGTIPALWKVASGTKTGQLLGKIADKMGGIEGVVPDAVQDAIHTSGMEIAPEVKAGLAADPQIQEMFKTLQQTDTTKSGLALQEAYNNFRNDAGHALIGALGKTPEEVDAIGDVSKYDFGKKIGSTLADEYEKQVSPLAQVFESFKSKFKSVDLAPELTLESGVKMPSTVDSIADKVSKAAIDEGWATSPSSDMMKLVNTTLKELPLQKTLKNLGDFISQVGANANKDKMNGPLRRAGGIINRILKDAEADVISAKLGETEGPIAVEAFKAARAGYAQQSALKEAIDSRLNAGGSTSEFAKALRTMASTDGETLLKRASGAGDADFLNFLQQNYPQTASAVKNFHITDMLKAAADKAKPRMTINSENLINKFNSMSPELKNFIASGESAGKINAVEQLLAEFNSLPHNYANTARTVDKLMQYIPGSVVGLVTMLHTHNPITSALVGGATKILGKDVPDAVRLSLLKFLGSDAPVNAGGFKNMFDFISHTVQGENTIGKSVKNLFKAGSEVIPQHLLPKAKDRKEVNKALDSIISDPEKVTEIAGNLGHYMPAHAAAMGESAGNAMRILRQLKPNTAPQNPLDSKQVISPAQQARYDRAVDIAQQPLIILKHIVDGRLTPEDVGLQKAMYPGLYSKLSQKLTDEAVKVLSKGGTIPYQTKMGLSLYVGQALDSTMTPQGIMGAQPKPPQNQPQTATQPASNPKRSTASLNKMPSMYRTPGQEAEKDRSDRSQ